MTYKEAFTEAYDLAIRQGATPGEAWEAGNWAQIALMDRNLDRADDARKEAKMWGGEMKPADVLRESTAHDDAGWLHAGLCKNTADLLDECERDFAYLLRELSNDSSHHARIMAILAKLRGQA